MGVQNIVGFATEDKLHPTAYDSSPEVLAGGGVIQWSEPDEFNCKLAVPDRTVVSPAIITP